MEPTSRIARLDTVTIDSNDPEMLATFWAAVFDTREEWRGGDPVQYIDLSETGWSPKLRFQRVPEAKTVKDRIHLDLRVDDIEETAARVTALGAERAPSDDFQEHNSAFRVMLDPEGNEFCLVKEAD
jgi:predicted enzyme related to lactoylglutathione lyase